MIALLRHLKGSILHPQWLTDRYHNSSRKVLAAIRDSVVLDIGSGDAGYSERMHGSCRLVKLDYPATNARYDARPEIYATVVNLPIAAASIDAVLLLEVLEHVDDDTSAIAEVARVLKPGGSLYLSVPFIYPIHDAPFDYRRYTIHGITQLLEKNGLQIVVTQQHGNGLVVAAQLLNLALLELVRSALRRNRLFGALLALLVTPTYLIINLSSWPLVISARPRRSCFGYFLQAKRKVSV